MKRYSCLGILFLLLLSGCVRVPPVDDGFVSSTVADRLDAQVTWDRCYTENNEVCTFIENAASDVLSADIAIQIALLNNPNIQSIFEEMGIAHADLVEAGLLSNPCFEFEIKFPHAKQLKTKIEYILVTSLLDIFLIPLRTKVAATEFQQKKLEVANAILDLAFEVRETFYKLIAESKKIGLAKSIVDLTEIINEISLRQLAVGNVNPLEQKMAQIRFSEAVVGLAESKIELIRLKEKLNRLLGFACDVCLLFPEELDDEDPQPLELCELESIALEERLDLQVARLEVIKLQRMLGLKQWWTYSNFKGGVAGEVEGDINHLFGPAFTGELPIFNYGQAARQRLFAQLRQAQDRWAALETKVLSEVREAHKVMSGHLGVIIDYQKRLMPMLADISNTSESLYNVMGLSVEKLLESKKRELWAKRNYVEVMKKYLVAKVELDRALGGNLVLFLLRKRCSEEICE